MRGIKCYKACGCCGVVFWARREKKMTCSDKCNRARHSQLLKGRISNQDTKGSNNPRWTGGLIKDKDGYLMRYAPDHPYKNGLGYVREHRLVAEKFLGRLLKPGEIIHHIDSNKINNKSSNLFLFKKKNDHDRYGTLCRYGKIKILKSNLLQVRLEEL